MRIHTNRISSHIRLFSTQNSQKLVQRNIFIVPFMKMTPCGLSWSIQGQWRYLGRSKANGGISVDPRPIVDYLGRSHANRGLSLSIPGQSRIILVDPRPIRMILVVPGRSRIISVVPGRSRIISVVPGRSRIISCLMPGRSRTISCLIPGRSRTISVDPRAIADYLGRSQANRGLSQLIPGQSQSRSR